MSRRAAKGPAAIAQGLVVLVLGTGLAAWLGWCARVFWWAAQGG